MFTTDALAAALTGRYAIDRLVGEGGMAQVYLARDLRHNRRVALKVLRPDLGAVLGVDRFQAEIEVTANLQHPNLLPLFDSGAAGDLLFYVMPFIEGESLRARLNREKQLPVDEAVRLATAIAAALDYAHRKGVIHRDLKPENILIHEGQPLVADFGIALAISNAGGARITQTGLSLGTPQYMSPEQATGDRAIDARTDIYSLGALTYEMLTGEPPHLGATSQAIIARVLTERPRDIRTTRPSVPEHVEATVMRALEKIPADRFATAKDFADALSGRAIATANARSGASTRDVSRYSRRERWLAVGVGVLLAALAADAIARWRAPGTIVAPPVVQFTFDTPNRTALQAAIAPDGHAIAYVAAINSNRAIVLRQLGSLALDTLRGTEGVFGSAVWSPDSREIAFFSDGKLKRYRISDHGVHVIGDVAGQSPRTGVLGLTWASDSTIVFTTLRGQLFRVPTSGGKALPISDWVGWRQPTALAADRILAIREVAGFPDSSGLFALSVAGGTPRRIAALVSRTSFVAPDQLLFVRDKALFAQRFDPGRLRLEGDPHLVAQAVGENAGNGAAGFAVSTNGTLVYSGGNAAGMNRLAWYSRSGARLSPVGDSARIADIALSPDERSIAISIRDATGSAELQTIDVARNVSSSLTRSALNAVWTRDSRSVVYGAPDAGGIHRIRIGAPDDSLVFRRNGVTLIPQDILADGSVLMLGGDSLLLALPATPGAQPRVLATIAGITETRMSPDEKQIAYGSNQSGTSQVYVARYPAMDERRQISSANGVQPRWSADGRELLFLDLQGILMTAPLRSGSSTEFLAPTVLFQSPDKVPRATASEWAPARDGKRFLFLEPVLRDEVALSSLTVVLNWTTLLKGSGSVHE